MFDYIFPSIILFLVGVCGIFIVRTNLIVILMSLELMLFAVNINFISFSIYLDDFLGQIFSFLVLTVAAAESAVGLAILVVYYRLRGYISIDVVSSLKG